MSGYAARDGLSDGAHDSLEAGALVLSDGAQTVGIVSVDLLNVSRSFVAAVRRRLAEDGTRFDELLVAATHTHAGPYVPAPAIELDSLLRVEENVETLVEDTVDALVEGVATALVRAYRRLEPATVRVGRAEECDVQHNRRASGGVSGNVRMPMGEIDPDVVAVLVETDSGNRTILYNFACHPVCTTSGETLLSADWPGYARERIAETYTGADILYLNGAAGDINPTRSSESRSGEAVYEYMSDVGTAVGDAVLRALADAEAKQSVGQPPIVARRTDLSLPMKRTPPRDRLEARIRELQETRVACEANGDDIGRDSVAYDEHYVQNLLDIANWGSRRLAAPLPYVEIGGIGLLGMPGEVFVRHVQRFKSGADCDVLVPVGYANEYVGYLPTLADFENGGYEVNMSKVSPEGIRTFSDEALDLIS